MEEQPEKKAEYTKGYTITDSVVTTCLDVVEVKTFCMDIPDIIVKGMGLQEDDRVQFVIEGPNRILFRKA